MAFPNWNIRLFLDSLSHDVTDSMQADQTEASVASHLEEQENCNDDAEKVRRQLSEKFENEKQQIVAEYEAKLKALQVS